MTISTVLLGYATVLAVAGPRVLTGSGWVDRAPNLAIALWQAITASVLAAAVLAALSLAVPAVGAGASVASLIDACLVALRGHYSDVGQPVVAVSAFIAALALCAWTVGHLVHGFVGALRERRLHVDMLAPIAQHDPSLGALVVEHDRPLAYCMPGRVHRIVVTSAVIERLDSEQLAAVLAHERAHLSCRHHLAVTAADALARAFPFVPLFRAAAGEVAHCVELAADDVAATRHDRQVIAAAVLSIAGEPVPGGALGAAGRRIARRVLRMIAQHQPLGRIARTATATVIVGLLAFPGFVAAHPAIAAALDRHCPIPF
ncbi:MAG: M48 family metalloprotease [Streptosporangiales bacterium]|nr:M48 family metalloprotease [Streptosporangiales bacterium]